MCVLSLGPQGARGAQVTKKRESATVPVVGESNAHSFEDSRGLTDNEESTFFVFQ